MCGLSSLKETVVIEIVAKKIDENINVFRLLRIARNRRIKDLSKELRVTPAYINAIENGSKIPSTRLIKNYAEALNVDENIILDFMDEASENRKFEEFLLLLLQRIVK